MVIKDLDEEGHLWREGRGRYAGVSRGLFCGPSGRAPAGSFPVNSEKRCRAALTYARYAPDPDGIRRCAIRKAKQYGWSCGTSSRALRSRGMAYSTGRKGSYKGRIYTTSGKRTPDLRSVSRRRRSSRRRYGRRTRSRRRR